MNSSLKWFLTLGLLLPATPSAFAQTPTASELDQFVAQQMQRFDVPGLGLAIVKDGKVLMSRGYGVRDTASKIPVNADTLFAIGSVSKSFTAVDIMRQVEQGKLKLDAPINTYLPGLKFSDPLKGAQVTLRHLLSMTSGLPRADNEWALNPSIVTRQQMLETISRIPFTADPGTTFQYCNQNYVAAGAALEAVTQQSWESYTQKNIFEPLGMKRSGFSYTDAQKDGNVATGYEPAFEGVQTLPAFDRLEIAGPAGSIHSSVNDMAQYLIFQMSDGRSSTGRLLSQASLDLMHGTQIKIANRDVPLTPGQAFPAYGMGWFSGEYRGYRFVEHGGNINGFTAEVAFMPDQHLGVVLLANLNGANEFTELTILGLLERYLKLNPQLDTSNAAYPALRSALSAAKTYRAAPEALKPLEGSYSLTSGEVLKISLQEGKLLVDLAGTRFELLPTAPNKFIINAQGIFVQIEFVPGSGGLMWLYQDGNLVGVRLSAASPAPATASEFSDPLKRFTLSLPAGQVATQNLNGITVVQYQNPEATFVLMVGKAEASLEASVTTQLRQVEPSFNISPSRSTVLPAINGTVWTQFLYSLPGAQTLVVLATQRGNNVYMIAVQTATAKLEAVTPLLQEIVSSYKIL